MTGTLSESSGTVEYSVLPSIKRWRSLKCHVVYQEETNAKFHGLLHLPNTTAGKYVVFSAVLGYSACETCIKDHDVIVT